MSFKSREMIKRWKNVCYTKVWRNFSCEIFCDNLKTLLLCLIVEHDTFLKILTVVFVNFQSSFTQHWTLLVHQKSERISKAKQANQQGETALISADLLLFFQSAPSSAKKRHFILQYCSALIILGLQQPLVVVINWYPQMFFSTFSNDTLYLSLTIS